MKINPFPSSDSGATPSSPYSPLSREQKASPPIQSEPLKDGSARPAKISKNSAPVTLAHGYQLFISQKSVPKALQKILAPIPYPHLDERLPFVATRQYLPRGFSQEQRKEIGCLRVAVHGWGASAAMYESIGRAMQRHPHTTCAMVAVDWPGHGNSAAPKNFPYDNPIAYVVTLHELIAQLKIEYGVKKVGLMGHSMGGGLAILYALLFPEDLNDLDLMNPWTSSEIPLAKTKSNRGIISRLNGDSLNFLIKFSSGSEGRGLLRKNPDLLNNLPTAFDKNEWGSQFGFTTHNEILLKTVDMDWSILQNLLETRPELIEGLKAQVPITMYRAASIDVVVPNRFVRSFAGQLGISHGAIVPISGTGHQSPLSPILLDKILASPKQ